MTKDPILVTPYAAKRQLEYTRGEIMINEQNIVINPINTPLASTEMSPAYNRVSLTQKNYKG